jgi:phosphate-selective porin OprO and OprP
MKLSKMLLIASCLSSMPVMAQEQSSANEIDSLRAEVQALKDQLATISAKVDANATAAESKKPAAASQSEVKWKGGPETSGPDGFTFKPRGRVQADLGVVNAPNSIVLPSSSLGTAVKFRRIYLGLDGTIPGGFGYRVEADIANSSVELTDVYLTYKKDKATITLGQHKSFSGLEEMTSDLFTTFQERAAYNSAFNFQRRVGLSATYADKDFLVQGGVFGASAADLNSDSNNSISFNGRMVYFPKIGDGQLHLGASAHKRQFNDAATTARYRARPFVRTTDVRLVDTRAFTSKGEHSFGLEAAYINGPFHATFEGHKLTSRRAGLANPSFTGGYAEVGMFVTKGDTLGYKGGLYDRTKPSNPLNKGGIGAIQISGRYDHLDLNDAGVIGGKQDIYGLSLMWIPTEYVRFIANYGHLKLQDSPIRAGLTGDYSADSFGIRAQVDF